MVKFKHQIYVNFIHSIFRCMFMNGTPRKYYYKAEQNIFPVSRDASVSELLL